MSHTPAISPDNFTSFGDLLKHLRKQVGLTQLELSIAVGYSDTQISRMEQNQRVPEAATLTARFVPALHLEREPEWVARLLDLAARARGSDGPAPIPDVSASTPPHQALPQQLTSFIGREEELAEIIRLLEQPDCRLLTILGPGGIGKTRLGLQTMEDVRQMFANGAYFVSLASLGSAEFIVNVIAASLKLSLDDSIKAEPKQQLIDYLRDKQLLLVIDNFDHLVESAGLLAEILSGAPHAKILVTSRERLNIRGEWLFEIHGLRFPASEAVRDLEGFSAVELFLQSARRVRSGFALSQADRSFVARTCRMVEGMPLALELAAAWVRVLDCRAIAQEIEHNLDFLTGSLRDVPERQRSLRAVFDTSWQMLTEAERHALGRLSVFRGGFGRDAAEQVAEANLSILASLVDKSLLRQSGDGRFEMHELLRQYAGHRLSESGEADATRARHLGFYVWLAEQVEVKLKGREQVEWVQRLEMELDNVRAALDWSRETDVQSGLRLAAALWWFWNRQNHYRKGRAWLEEALSQPAALEHTPARAKALFALSVMACGQGDEQVSCPLAEESVRMWRQVGPDQSEGLALALAHLGHECAIIRRFAQALASAEEAIAMFRKLNPTNRWGLAFALWGRAMVAEISGDYAVMPPLWAEASIICEELEDHWLAAVLHRSLGFHAYYVTGELEEARSNFRSAVTAATMVMDWHIASSALNHLGDVARAQGDYDQVATLHDKVLAMDRDVIGKHEVARSFLGLGFAANHQGDHQRAAALFKESLTSFREMSDGPNITLCLEGCAGMAADLVQGKRAARLLGAAEALREGIGLTLWPAERVEHERSAGVVRAILGDEEFTAAWAEGRAMPMNQAIDYALSTQL